MGNIVNMQCKPHVSKIEWEVDSVTSDLENDTLNINVKGKQIIDRLDVEIKIEN